MQARRERAGSSPKTTTRERRDSALEASGEQMRAIAQDEYGSADALELRTIQRPQIGANEVLVQVHAAGVDRGVWHLMSGLPYLLRLAGYGITKPKNLVPGLDLAGTVVEIGRAVTRFKVGDAVFGIGRGSFAEYAAAEENKLALKPANVSFEQAAVSAVSGITALQALTDVGELRSGQSVLVIGASGGVGSFAVQLARTLGGEVTGIASTGKLDMVRALGADHVIDYTQHDFADTGRRYELVVDIGGRNSVSRLRRVLTPTGTLVIVGGEDGGRLTGGVGRQLRAKLLSPFTKQRLTTFISTEHHTYIDRLARHLETGAVVPAVGKTYALEHVPEAIRQLENGSTRGKSAIVIAGDRAARAS